jgi:uncharacterized repeat protein (TIGR03803 family)
MKNPLMKPMIKLACSFALIAIALLISVDRTQGAAPQVLYNFTNGLDGSYPLCQLLRTSDGTLYGTTYTGGANGYGTVFKYGPNKSVPITLVSFDYNTTGAYPYAGLIQGSDGNFYGTTYEGGANGYGTIFKMKPNGAITVLASLDYNTTGGYIYAPLVQGTDGNFYGVAYQGGANGYGTVFRVKPNGNIKAMFSFDYNTTGAYPYGGLIQATDGNFYGTASQGGVNLYGTVFRMTANGTPTALFSFDNSATYGGYPYCGLTQAPDGSLYGANYAGGTFGYGTIFALNPAHQPWGVVNLANFDYTTTGGLPYGFYLVTDGNGNFYGTTYEGGANGVGTVFKYTLKKNLTTLASLNSSTTGAYPYGGVALGTDGFLYGAIYQGGTKGYGTLIKLAK